VQPSESNAMGEQPPVFDNLDDCVDLAIERVGPDLVLGAPLGLGKPVQLLNAFYARARRDPSISLHIYTALSLEVPVPQSEIEASLAGPIMERLFGDYEGLAYMPDLRDGTLPDNVRVSELYVKAGAMKGVGSAQREYISSNYTHIARDLCAAGVNVLCQLVAFRESAAGLELSLSCNPDTAEDLLTQLDRERPGQYVAFAQLHADLPFMENDAQLAPDSFTALLRNPVWDRRLFAVPNAAVPATDYATALHASALVVDGGTLQIGIGALGDAVAQSLILRQQNNAAYRELIKELTVHADAPEMHLEPFTQGLYVSTEMFVYGMLRLMEEGVVKRRVYDNLALQQGINSGEIGETVDSALYDYASRAGLLPSVLDEQSLSLLQHFGLVARDVVLGQETLTIVGASYANDTRDPDTRAALLDGVAGQALLGGTILHGGFFLGPGDFYEKLRNLDADGQSRICMTSVQRTNQLLQDPPLYMAQRRDARFINTGMMVSLSGAVTSDALEDGTVISGVGGQYNFVAMAHDLPGARSVLCIRATRPSRDKVESNIVPFYGHVTIPRHLRDLVVTEYGVADLRGQSDEEVIKRLLAVTDSRFQQELLDFARTAGKIDPQYSIPLEQRYNTPAHVASTLRSAQQSGLLPDYPFGTELTDQEIQLAASLRRIKALSDEPSHFIRRAFRALLHHADSALARPYLERIHLEHPHTSREFLIQQLLLLDLEERGLLQVS
jgi:acyl-CoA hydrolase